MNSVNSGLLITFLMLLLSPTLVSSNAILTEQQALLPEEKTDEPEQKQAAISSDNINQTTTWAKTYGGPGLDQTRNIIVTKDGGFMTVGESKSFSEGNDIWAIKLDKDGNIEWQKRYNGWGYEAAETHSLRQTADGGYIFSGQTDSFGAKRADIWIIKLDPDGNIEWQKRYGGDDIDRTRSIQQTPDEGFIVTGKTHSFGAGTRDFWVLKLDKAGNIEWQKTYGGADYDVPRSIQLTPKDNGYLIAGWTKSFGLRAGDFWVLKLDEAGNIEWQKTYGGNGFEEPADIQLTPDGGYIIFEETWSFSSDRINIEDAWVLKLDEAGNIEWQKTYGGNGFDELSSLYQTPSKKYVLVGQTNSTGVAGRNDTWAVQLDQYGNIEWQKTYGGIGADEGESMQATPEGGYVIAGRTNSFGAGSFDIWIIKVDEDGMLYGCNEGTNSSLQINQIANMTVQNSTGSLTDSTARIKNSTAIPSETNATTFDTTATVYTQCEGIAPEKNQDEPLALNR